MGNEPQLEAGCPIDRGVLIRYLKNVLSTKHTPTKSTTENGARAGRRVFIESLLDSISTGALDWESIAWLKEFDTSTINDDGLLLKSMILEKARR